MGSESPKHVREATRASGRVVAVGPATMKPAPLYTSPYWRSAPNVSTAYVVQVKYHLIKEIRKMKE